MTSDSLHVNIATRGTQNTTYDAIVSGSGISGGRAVNELDEKRPGAMVLEWGHDVVQVKDYLRP
ncbi:MAG: hypothetical protein M3342_08935 [Bacteroidota bacterium]|nr:hypothetical protein [Bacteroidota bacterium]